MVWEGSVTNSKLYTCVKSFWLVSPLLVSQQDHLYVVYRLAECSDRHSASMLCVYLGYDFAGKEHMTPEMLLQMLIGSLTLKLE